uniref:Uncharacterized protein n=1 Tax=Cacopsylla melanoneura TaxID=428564 RepID=A0A8D8Z773_9HEMI
MRGILLKILDGKGERSARACCTENIIFWKEVLENVTKTSSHTVSKNKKTRSRRVRGSRKRIRHTRSLSINRCGGEGVGGTTIADFISLQTASRAAEERQFHVRHLLHETFDSPQQDTIELSEINQLVGLIAVGRGPNSWHGSRLT